MLEANLKPTVGAIRSRLPSFDGDVLGQIVWPIAIPAFVYRCLVLPAFGDSVDLQPELLAARDLLHGLPPYSVHLLLPSLYPPSALVLLAPLALLSFAKAKLLFLGLNAGAILLATRLLFQVLGLKWRSGTGAVTLLALALAWPVFSTLTGGNVNGLVLAGEAAMLLAATRGEWTLAGAVLGVTLAIKPVMFPLLLLFLFRREFIGLVAAIAVPILLSVLAVLVDHQALAFLTQAVPILLAGNAPNLHSYNVALTGLTENLNVPLIITTTARVLVAVAVALMVRQVWRRADRTLALVETSSLLLIGTFLCFSFSWRYYGIFLLPVAISVVRAEALFRHPLAWMGVYCIFTLDIWTSRHLPDFANHMLWMLPTLGYLLILAAFELGVASQGKALGRRVRPQYGQDHELYPTNPQVLPK